MHLQTNHLSTRIYTDEKAIHYSLQELIRRWDSKRELFYVDIVHVEASAYAHWTDFLISTNTYLY